MSGQTEEATPGNSGSSGDATSDRAALAGELDKLAETLTEAHRRLTHSLAGQDAQTFWELGVDRMKKFVKDVDRLKNRCESAWANDVEREREIHGENDADFNDETDIFNDAEDDGEVDVVSEALHQLDKAVKLAVEKVNAAVDVLGDRYLHLPDVRSRIFREAAEQLLELSSRCAALAVQMRGPAALA